MKSSVTYLKVPYSEKESAKDLGAKWDPNEKLWYVPRGIELDDFSRWLENTPNKEMQNNQN